MHTDAACTSAASLTWAPTTVGTCTAGNSTPDVWYEVPFAFCAGDSCSSGRSSDSSDSSMDKVTTDTKTEDAGASTLAVGAALAASALYL